MVFCIHITCKAFFKALFLDMSLQKIININADSCGDNDSRCGRESPRQTELSVTDAHLFLSYSSHLRIANQQEHPWPAANVAGN